MGLLVKNILFKAAGGHLELLPFSAKRDMLLLLYELFDFYYSIFHLNAIKMLFIVIEGGHFVFRAP